MRFIYYLAIDGNSGAIVAAHSWVSAPILNSRQYPWTRRKIGGVRGWVKQLAFDNVQYSAPVVTLRNLFERRVVAGQM
jgi:hypothetical protein